MTDLTLDAILRNAYTATAAPEFTPEQLEQLVEPFDSDRHERLMPVPLPIQHLLASLLMLESLHDNAKASLENAEDKDAFNAAVEAHNAVCRKRKKILRLISILTGEVVGDDTKANYAGVCITDDLQFAGFIAAEESALELPPELAAVILAMMLRGRHIH